MAFHAIVSIISQTVYIGMIGMNTHTLAPVPVFIKIFQKGFVIKCCFQIPQVLFV